MKFPNWFRIAWWVLILLLTSYGLCKRFDAIVAGHDIPFDVFLFLVWVALMLVPIFQEVNFFGIKLKQSVDALKSEVSQLKSTINNNINVKPVFNFTPTDSSQLKELEQKYNDVLDLVLQQNKKKPASQITAFLGVPQDNQILFSARFRIETELRRIWRYAFRPDANMQFYPVAKMLMELRKVDLISNELYGPLKEVIAICNYGIHGEDVAPEQVTFVKDLSPKLIAALEDLQ